MDYLKAAKFKKAHLFIVIPLVAITTLSVYWVAQNRSDASENQPPATVEEINEELPDGQTPAQPIEETNEDPPVVQWPIILTHEQAASLTVVVNKKHKLPSDFVPNLKSVSGGQLRPEAADALTGLLNAANAAGVPMSILSSYRSYSAQVSTYNKWVSQSGQAAADTFSARPGHSEHQTGLAVDLGNGTCDLETCFGDTAAGKWLAAHAHEYGFIIRYEKSKDAITGYQYEPWHLRYVGNDTASAITVSGKTMDEFFNVLGGGYN